jgi:AraC-like DNA-binding protein
VKSRLDAVQDWEARAEEAGYCVATLAEMHGVSKRQFDRYILKRFGETPKDWTRRLRMERAVALILGCHQIQEIARDLKFARAAEFDRTFRQYFGVTPGAFRESASRPNQEVARLAYKSRV